MQNSTLSPSSGRLWRWLSYGAGMAWIGPAFNQSPAHLRRQHFTFASSSKLCLANERACCRAPQGHASQLLTIFTIFLLLTGLLGSS